ncbi:hypothetical protein GYH30_021614 [Glycine max]|nr:hypothetical protein GYH30_021614 [Glycine max]
MEEAGAWVRPRLNTMLSLGEYFLRQGCHHARAVDSGVVVQMLGKRRVAVVEMELGSTCGHRWASYPSTTTLQ